MIVRLTWDMETEGDYQLDFYDGEDENSFHDGYIWFSNIGGDSDPNRVGYSAIVPEGENKEITAIKILEYRLNEYYKSGTLTKILNEIAQLRSMIAELRIENK